MRLLNKIRSRSLKIAATWMLMALGCNQNTTPLVPQPEQVIGESWGDGKYFLTSLIWEKGLRVVVFDDCHGTGKTETRNINSVDGAKPKFQFHMTKYADVAAGVRVDTGAVVYTWKIVSEDGKTASCEINNKQYDLSNGTLFVIKVKEKDGVGVNQLKRDMSDQKTLQLDAEVLKILGTTAAAK
jgi:hypothetical protein